MKDPLGFMGLRAFGGITPWVVVTGLQLFTGFVQAEVPPKPAADVWYTNSVVYPPPALSHCANATRFESLHAELLAGTLKMLWTPSATNVARQATLHVSADEPGHWPARDWRTYPMEKRGTNWETMVPVDSLDAPLLYFVTAVAPTGTNVSWMRLCRLRELGMETPSRLFWPFVEGFEEGTESWRWLAGAPENGQFKTTHLARKGKAALAVTIPAGKASATIGTTRLRGWHLLEHGANGISVCLRVREGTGRARFSVFANAFSTNQVMATRTADTLVSADWQQVELPFSSFSKFPLVGLDFFTIEFVGAPGAEFLVDELQLLGSWELD